ncbi:MAG: hypothetical protein EOO04_38320 [Chitinophagaceae bacterium]|nr:MAG: hypothetical protein EOO04_38320 [Chitinophagaceae bacterium]
MRSKPYISTIIFIQQMVQKLFLVFLLSGVLQSYGQNLNTPNKPGPLGTFVNTISGNLFVPRTDFSITARGFNFHISFYYNSFLF